ncbi:MAG: hypothetical protein AAFR91_09890 [Pseudomonadota bacterium]
MWIPTRVYEALPKAYAMAGILVIFSTIYNGLYDSLAYGWMFVGVFLIGNAVHLTMLRERFRGDDHRSNDSNLMESDFLAETVISRG